MGDSVTVFKGGKLIDGNGGPAVDESVVVIEGERISRVGRMGRVKFSPEANVIDVTGKTLMPGLIDAHLHLAGYVTFDSAQSIMEDPYLRVIRAAIDSWRLLDSGFTAVRDCQSYHTLLLRQAIEEGSLHGPHIVSCGMAITQTCGHMDEWHSLPLGWVIERGLCRIADGPDECRKAAREQLRAGADFIKIATTGGVMSQRGFPTSTQYTVEEIRAVVEEAHALGKKVASHAQGTQGIKNALIAGVDSIEHGVYLDEEAIEMMVKQGTFLIPTLAVVEAILTKGPDAGIQEKSLEKAQSIRDAHVKSFQKAWQAGVKFGLGTDYFLSPTVVGEFMGDHACELEYYVKAGLRPMEAIVCATRNNAEVLGLKDRLGTLEAGKIADLIVVNGDPLEDITVLRDRGNIESVYKLGEPVPRLSR